MDSVTLRIAHNDTKLINVGVSITLDIKIYLYNKLCWLLAWLVDYLLLRDFGPYGIIFMNVCVVITVAIVMLLRDFGTYGILFMTMCIYYFIFSRHCDGQYISSVIIGYI
jgi:uncharacterized YccA/Bax inhibitor family protein